MFNFFTFAEKIQIKSGSLSSQRGDHSALRAYDDVARTFCHTEKRAVNTLTLEFEETFVVDVEIVNRHSKLLNTLNRLIGAKVKLMRGETEIKTCGTIDNTAEMIFRLICNEAGSSLTIEQENKYLHVAEVRIYGLGEFALQKNSIRL